MNTWRTTRVSQRLGLDVPIIQGPFGGGLSSVNLAACVSEAGGLGSFGVHHLTAPDISKVAAAIRAQTQKPFALNLWLPFDQSDAQPSPVQYQEYLQPLLPYYTELGLPVPEQPQHFSPDFDEQMHAVLEARPKVFSFVYGVPPTWVIEQCKSLGIMTLGAATTPDEARALEAGGVDMVVATGFEAGGHRVSFLRKPEESLMGTFSLIPQVVDAVRIPVVAAGGIADGRGIAAALTLGADAVQIGTAFLACVESGTSQLHRNKILSNEAKYTGLTRAFSGRLARGIQNRFMNDLRDSALAPYPIQNWLTGKLKLAATEQARAELMSLWCGQSAPLLKHTEAQVLLTSLIQQTDQIYLGK
ncbi:nitronate monooxygenase [Cellvibrio zantedeschiae]|uniref:Propionate 3-nitronate monooxygenase n=1 Tax=Cellvibrio zantedeschiae TaxID=1237077 RepID=A0ABQ3AR30_9GAMM|nr:nitronate monooxygenase [Cellvibrio zantedeschiae]GGY62044.1 nitronate monooxygenase [Cellvibrio zantedeschiae]